MRIQNVFSFVKTHHYGFKPLYQSQGPNEQLVPCLSGIHTQDYTVMNLHYCCLLHWEHACCLKICQSSEATARTPLKLLLGVEKG